MLHRNGAENIEVDFFRFISIQTDQTHCKIEARKKKKQFHTGEEHWAFFVVDTSYIITLIFSF